MHPPEVLGLNPASIVVRTFGQHDRCSFELSPKTEGCSDEDRLRNVAKRMPDAGFGSRSIAIV